MATITGGEAFIVLMAALTGGLDKPTPNWAEVNTQTPAAQCAYRQLDLQGHLDSKQPGDTPQAAPSGHREKISPQDFFRIGELAPKAIRSPHALKESPAGAATLLHIRTSDGANYYFVGEQGEFKDDHVQEIRGILCKYRNEAR